MFKFKWLYLFILIVFFVPKSYLKAQDEKFKSIFIYNFTKLVEWPTESQTSEFIITVCGNSEIVKELKEIAGKMKVYNKSIIIKTTSTLSQVQSSQILYITRDKTAELQDKAEAILHKNILIITEKPSACSLGSGINFITKGGNLSFEINPASLEKAGLKVNSQLLTLGTVIKK